MDGKHERRRGAAETETDPGDAGRALDEAEARHGLLLDTLPHGVQENDCDGVITYSNRAHHQLLGYRPGELLGRRIWDQIPEPADRAALREHLGTLVTEQPTPVPYLARNRRKDGALLDLQIDWNYQRAADGTLTGFISVITDVTERRRAAQALRYRSEASAALIEVSSNLAATLDTDAILQAAVEGVPRVMRLGTAAIYLLVGERLSLRATTPPLPEDFPEQMREAELSDHPHIGAAIASGEPVLVDDFEGAGLTPAERAIAEQRELRTLVFVPLVVDARPQGVFIAGSTRVLSPLPEGALDLCRALASLSALALRNAQLYEQGREHAVQLQNSLCARVRAEAEREAAQQQLAQSQKMESIGRLAGGVAHDFNNMLGVILGRAELALAKTESAHPLHAHLLQILDAANRSAKLTRQLLAFARRQTIDPRVLDPNAEVREALGMLRRMIGEDIELVWEPGRDVGSVRMDPTQVQQVLTNLCVNARDAISGPGRIAIATGNATLVENEHGRPPGHPAGEFVVLSVSDTGHGIEEAVRDRIFEPFFTTKEPGEGTGLGLSTVYGIVSQNGGFVELRAGLAKGATFDVYLPRCRTEAGPRRDGGAAAEALGAGQTILLVEDEPMILDLGREMLESLGYRVLTAAGPREALSVASSGRVDLLITDMVMPGMNGGELAAALQARRPGLPALFISGHAADVVARRGVLPEGSSFLAKPFTREELGSSVAEILRAD